MSHLPPIDCRENNSRDDLPGKQIGFLRVEAPTERRTPSGEIIWRCRCICGRSAEVTTSNLSGGNSSSCGCMRSIMPAAREIADRITPHLHLVAGSNAELGEFAARVRLAVRVVSRRRGIRRTDLAHRLAIAIARGVPPERIDWPDWVIEPSNDMPAWRNQILGDQFPPSFPRGPEASDRQYHGSPIDL